MEGVEGVEVLVIGVMGVMGVEYERRIGGCVYGDIIFRHPGEVREIFLGIADLERYCNRVRRIIVKFM